MMGKQHGNGSSIAKEKVKRTGEGMMFIDKQNKYLKKKKKEVAVERKKKANRLFYLEKKMFNSLSSKERKEVKSLKAELKKGEDSARKKKE